MPTSVHIPPPVLEAIDAKARALGISRNRLIVRALERELDQPTGWSPEFVQRLRHLDEGAARVFDESMRVVRRARSSKAPVKL